MAKIFGYGVDLSKLNFTDETKMKEFIKRYLPDFAKEIDINEKENEVDIFECIDNYNNDLGYDGLSALLADVINEQEQIQLSAYDFIPNGYIYIPANYPWQFNNKEKRLTAESMQEILKKYLSKITDDKIICEDLDLYIESLD